MSFPFDIDGAVVKVNNLSDRNKLGSTAKFPKWAIAYKYPPEQKPSQVLDIVVQVGRTGVLTPRAVLSPVHLAGTTVQSATLHNQDYIAEKDIRIGDTVVVQKAGEIIPEIVEVDFSKRPEGTSPYELPEFCPVCGAPVSRDLDGAALRCTGAECPAQLLRNIAHFASRDAMKEKTIYYCTECGNETAKWAGKCPACGAWNTIVEQPAIKKSRNGKSTFSGVPIHKAHPVTSLDTAEEIRFFTGMQQAALKASYKAFSDMQGMSLFQMNK